MNAIYIVKQHKVTGEIVKVDVASNNIVVIDGRIRDIELIKKNTAEKTDFVIIGTEGEAAPRVESTGRKITIREAFGISDDPTWNALKAEGRN